MATVNIPASLGGSGTTYSDGTDANGMQGPDGLGYTRKLIPMLGEIVALGDYNSRQTQAVVAAGAAPMWVSGTTYALGATAWSPSTYHTFRKKTASSVSTTDPASDATNWTQLTLATVSGRLLLGGAVDDLTSTLQVAGGASFTGAISVAGKKVLELPSNNPERGPNNSFWASVRGSGRALYLDEDFVSGLNGVGVYNNSGGTGLTITREADATAPNSSGFRLKINVDGVGATSPGLGGFILQINARANATFVQIFRAKVPAGYTLEMAENAQGTNNTSYWLTNNAGTGKWEDYTRVSHCGNTGTFSSGGQVYLNGPAGAVIWYLASANVFDVTAAPAYGSTTATANTLVQRDASGNFTASSAAVLTTPRTINGVNFDGSANITVAASATTLTGVVPIASGGTGATTRKAASSAVANFGQLEGHGTYNDFNAVQQFGGTFVQGTTNGPAVNSAGQYYQLMLSLGSEYDWSSAGIYAMQMAIPRTPTGMPYLTMRQKEGGTALLNWGAWTKFAAGQADVLTTARLINGVSFNGSADITVVAAAGTLTGTTLAAGVTASSLTSVGTLTSLAVTGNASSKEVALSGVANVAAGVASTGVHFGGTGIAHANIAWKPNERELSFQTGNTATDLANAYGLINLRINGTLSATGTVTRTASALANNTGFASTSSGTYANYNTTANSGGILQYGLDDSIGSVFGTAAYASVWNSPAAHYVQIAGVNKAVVSSTGLAVTGTLSATGAVTASNHVGPLSDSGYKTITNPGGANFGSGSGSVGAIAITLPVGMTDTMVRMTVQVYEYATNRSFTLHCGGYTYAGAGLNTWANNPFAYIVGNPGIARQLTVRFGYTAAGKAVVYIGELGSGWEYPQVFVTDLQAGYSGQSAAWLTGWTIGLRTGTFENVTATITDPQVGYASSTSVAGALVKRDTAGHLYGNYLFGSYANTTDDVSAGTVTYLMGKFGDDYHRSATPAKVKTFLEGAAGAWAIAISGNAATASSAAVLTTARLINGVSFNGSADITVAAAAGTLTGATLAAGVTASSLTSVGTLTSLNVSGAVALTAAGSATVPTIHLNGATNNWVAFNTSGVGAPTFTTRSAGVKLSLYPGLAAASADYSIGIEVSTLWSGVPTTAEQFKWYGGTTLAATLSGLGDMSLTRNLTVSGTIQMSASGVVSSAQAAFYMKDDIGTGNPGLHFRAGTYIDSPSANNIRVTGTLMPTLGLNAVGGAAGPATQHGVFLSSASGQAAAMFTDSSRAVDLRRHEFLWGGGVFSGRLINDAYTAAAPWVEVSGTHTAISNMNLRGTTITAYTTNFNVNGGYLYTNDHLYADKSVFPRSNPSAFWGIDFTQNNAGASSGSNVVAAAGTYDLAVGSGIVAIHDNETGGLGLYICYAGVVTKIAGPADYVAGTGGAGQTGLVYNSGVNKYRINNGNTVSRTYWISTIRTRPSS